jgi:acyl-CoA thioesterase-1
MVSEAKSAKAKVLLLGIKLPPNYGAIFLREFEAVFVDVARPTRFRSCHLFEGFGEKPRYFQADRINPTAEGSRNTRQRRPC